MGGPLDFGVVIFMGNVITRKAPRRIHAGDRRPRSEVLRPRPGSAGHQGSPRSRLQCMQGRTRGWGIVYAACHDGVVFL